MMVPLVTPTQPQTVALSAISATSRPASAAGGGNSRCRRWLGEVGVGAQPLHVAVAVGGVADEDDAGQLAVAQR